MMDNVDQSLMTFTLTAVCSPSYFKNPYLVAKIIEILFVINPSVQVSNKSSSSSFEDRPRSLPGNS
jgi:ubiquitin conjugation factor E4 B